MLDTFYVYIVEFFGFNPSYPIDEILSEIIPLFFPIALFIMAFLPLKLFFKLFWG